VKKYVSSGEIESLKYAAVMDEFIEKDGNEEQITNSKKRRSVFDSAREKIDFYTILPNQLTRYRNQLRRYRTEGGSKKSKKFKKSRKTKSRKSKKSQKRRR
jgi:hypothetical protein